ncbi:MAG: radical SAM protein [Bacteroidia bacterium]|nr:radical SAM protein [Bacteroidia bacterium]
MVASEQKVGFHVEKLNQYITGHSIFPVTLELDITSTCSRVCKDCPSARSPVKQELDLAFIENLFDSFEGQTKGLLLTGGEPTISPVFPNVLALARKKGFENIAVVTNGSELDQPHVMESLAEHASTIRLSLYDWEEEACFDISNTLQKIEKLRNKIDKEKSNLKIGISALTATDRIGKVPIITKKVCTAGAHWIYFHPMCSGWTNRHLEQVNQHGVIEAIGGLVNTSMNGFRIFFSKARYSDSKLRFNQYHSAHFLLVVGADGKNYLGAEVKYNPDFVIADVKGQWKPQFLHNPDRINRIQQVNDKNYIAIKSRHRGVLYNDYIEQVIEGRSIIRPGNNQLQASEFWFPYIL